MNLQAIQSELQQTGLDGWLFFDHHERDPLAYAILFVEGGGARVTGEMQTEFVRP